jgi:hypothetical protein
LTTSSQPAAVVGAAEHGNSAMLVTVAPGGRLLDRRCIDFTQGLPTHPYHHEGSWSVGRYLNSSWARPISRPAALELIERVHAAALSGAQQALDELAAIVSLPIASIAIRVCAALPATIEARITDTRANTFADSVMYREALATAAQARGWTLHWYDPKQVRQQAQGALRSDDLDTVLHAMGRIAGPPWQAKHKLAATAALAATGVR